MTLAVCREAGCGKPKKARGLCNMHYLRAWKLGGTSALPEMDRPSISERFWAKVDKSDECWVWTAAESGHDGYGGFDVNGRWVRASRVSWELAHGPIQTGLHVLHKCDNPPCVRPDHLFLGTQLDNIRDRDQKGRQVAPRGERNGWHKLTADSVREIRRLCATGLRRRDVANSFNVTKSTVGRIVQRKAWAHISD